MAGGTGWQPTTRGRRQTSARRCSPFRVRAGWGESIQQVRRVDPAAVQNQGALRCDALPLLCDDTPASVPCVLIEAAMTVCAGQMALVVCTAVAACPPSWHVPVLACCLLAQAQSRPRCV